MLRCLSGQNTKFLDLSKYEMVNKVGTESYLAVYLMKEISTNNFYVFRIINSLNFKSKKFLEFANLVKLIDLPNFNRIHFCDYLSNFIGYRSKFTEKYHKDTIVFVVDYIQNNNLELLTKRYLEGDTSIITPTIRNKIIFGVASSMKYLHKNNILHRNLKNSHILLDDNFEPVVTFSSVSQFMTNDFDINIAGTPICTAPEVIEDNDNIGFPSDVYSFSIFLYRLFEPDVKFENDKSKLTCFKLFRRIVKGDRFIKPNNISESFWNLIQNCWKQNPDERLTFDQIVTELKNDKYALNEFGMKTDLDELHEYQNRIEKNRPAHVEFYNLMKSLHK